MQLRTGFPVFFLGALVFGEHILGTRTQLIAKRGENIHLLLILEEGASAGLKINAKHPFVRFNLKNFEQADLAGGGRMRTAARSGRCSASCFVSK